ncbi:MAG: sigma-70 family RNA polymerase sigma factor [Thermomicrobiales bacterium]|nr:sigma-70 family RNA polymerase sigma factor [Thermomicrobiales bacterium]MCO5222726.1 sigma-70 family RNA polymerase sigma factor [Thermomicrobiales bacterium]
MVANQVWNERVPGTLRWRSDRTTKQEAEPSAQVVAFADLYEEHARSILRYCQLRIADPAEAEDAAALIFTRAFSAWPPANPEATRAWLFTIAHNVVANHYRSQAVRGYQQPLDDALELHDPAATPLEQTIERERTRELRTAIEQLSTDQRDVVELRLAGLTGPEIAASLGKSHAAVKMLQLRAVQRLRTIMTPHPSLQETDR